MALDHSLCFSSLPTSMLPFFSAVSHFFHLIIFPDDLVKSDLSFLSHFAFLRLNLAIIFLWWHIFINLE